VEATAALERDAALMLLVRDGCSASFEVLLLRYRVPVTQFIYRMVQDRAVAEELGQEVFLRVYRARSSYQPAAKFTTWLFRIAMHVSLNCIRDCKGERGTESLDQQNEAGPTRQVCDHRPTVEQYLIRQAGLEEVRRAIGTLPSKQRAAVLMHKYSEMDYNQIAAALNCSESAIKSLLFRAYESLRMRLAQFA
jgi:RNA polymerase sigma-70 factor (ECF subfamily)